MPKTKQPKKSISKLQTLTNLCKLAAAIERRGKDIWKISDLAAELGWNHRTTCRYLDDLRELGPKTDRPVEGADKLGSMVTEKWRLVDAIRQLMI